MTGSAGKFGHMTSHYQQAVELARALLAHKTDKAGRPAFHHAVRVAAKVGPGRDATVAYLHDLVEDTDLSLKAVRAIFGREIAEDVDALTRRHEERYFDYIARVCRASAVARRVKLADIEDHLDDPQHIPESLIARYVKAKTLLEHPCPGNGIEAASWLASAGGTAPNLEYVPRRRPPDFDFEEPEEVGDGLEP